MKAKYLIYVFLLMGFSTVFAGVDVNDIDDQNAYKVERIKLEKNISQLCF